MSENSADYIIAAVKAGDLLEVDRESLIEILELFKGAKVPVNYSWSAGEPVRLWLNPLARNEHG